MTTLPKCTDDMICVELCFRYFHMQFHSEFRYFRSKNILQYFLQNVSHFIQVFNYLSMSQILLVSEVNVPTYALKTELCGDVEFVVTGNTGGCLTTTSDATNDDKLSAMFVFYTVKPVYNDHLMGYFSAFWSSSRLATQMSSRRHKLLVRVNWYLQSSSKDITELITGNKSYYRGGRYRQVSLYIAVDGHDIILYLPRQRDCELHRVWSICREARLRTDSARHWQRRHLLRTNSYALCHLCTRGRSVSFRGSATRVYARKVVQSVKQRIKHGILHCVDSCSNSF